MKKLFLFITLFTAMMLTGCKKEKPQTGDKDTLDTDSVRKEMTPQTALPDTTLWGRNGDGTTSGVLEFITEKGDTLYLSRTSDTTGEEADIVGTWREESDRFAVTTRGKKVDDGLSMRSCINVTELMGVWRSGKNKLAFYADGTADNEQLQYKKWKCINGQLIVTRKATTEYGETERQDTLRIAYLDEHNLKLVTPQHEELSYEK